MNRELLLQHFDRISEAPDAIPRLRRFILDLAVRGKLVEQDPSDEPAEELLKRIHKWQSEAIQRKQIRAPKKTLNTVSKDEMPYLLPKGWEWARLGKILYIQSGDGLTAANMEHGEIPVFGGNGINGYHNNHNVEASTIVIGRVGYYCGSIHLTPSKAWVTDNAFITQYCHESIYQNFLLLLLSGTNLKERENATAQPVISGSKIYPIVIGLPPLAEQHRIVAKVDELMALCDQLEAERNKREARRDRLVASSLNRISTTTAEEAKDSTRFHLNHLPRLTTRTEHIKQLRQTILNLAVRGRLVPHDPNDESAAELLKRIQVEKKQLVKEGKIRLQAIDPSMEKVDTLFEIPNTWKWVLFGDIAFVLSGYAFNSADFTKQNGTKVIKITNAGVRQFVETDERLPESFCIKHKNFVVFKGDLVLALTRPYIEDGLKISVCPDSYDGALLNQRVAAIRTGELMDKNYVYLFLRSPHVLNIYKKRFEGHGLQPNLKITDVAGLQFPLPPLAEQQRIVAKVDELMALCDQLEASLNTTEADSRRLLEAVLHDALNPVIKEAV